MCFPLPTVAKQHAWALLLVIMQMLMATRIMIPRLSLKEGGSLVLNFNFFENKLLSPSFETPEYISEDHRII